MRALRIFLIITLSIISLAFIATKVFKVNPPLKILKTEGSLPVHLLNLPEGFQVSIYAQGILNARSMTFGSSDSILFVGTRGEGNVYALVDYDLDYKADNVFTLLTEGNMPNGVAFKNGDLYVAEVNRILRFRNIEDNLENPGDPEIIYDGYPDKSHHGWKYIAFGPDERLYVPVGAPCNICESEDEIFNSITALDIKTKEVEILHRGIRNTVGFDWHPKTKNLWFTDNGRDMMGDNKPECELNRAEKVNMHFGYPYCHQGDLPDPKFGKDKDCTKFSPPATKLGPHTAPLGMEFYKGESFPLYYKNSIYVARHGSWNRSEKIGYDVVHVKLDSNNNVVSTAPFVSGWLSDDKKDVWGRPVDIEECSNGSILISDDFGDAIYYVSYRENE